jgi:anti-sigma regulatory factor (Ser/Thr protein kinase)
MIGSLRGRGPGWHNLKGMSRLADRRPADNRDGVSNSHDRTSWGGSGPRPRPRGADGRLRSASSAGRAPPESPPPLDQPFDAHSLSQLRRAVAGHAAAAGMAADRIQDAVIAVHELAANAVHHGAGHGRVRQWSDRWLLHSRVSDPGPAHRDTVAPAEQPSWPAIYGHGLWLVNRAADRVTVKHDQNGTNVTISFAIGPA